MLETCGKNALHNHGKSDNKPGPGCPIGGLFDLGGVCCLSCMAECDEKPASFSPATSYALSTLAFLFVVMGSVWAFGRAAIDRLKEDAKG